MKVIVVGAGIGGLSAAIALNRAGHDVEVYERSSFLNEVGAAIHIATNASHFLEDWGCDFKALDPVDCHSINRVDGSNLNLIENIVDIKKVLKENHIKYPYMMTHRVDLHNHLRFLAEKGHQGRTVKIFLRSKVDSVDAETGEVHFMDGRTVQGDLVIGADGLHSQTVQAILSTGRTKISTGQIVFRFLVPTEKAESNPLVRDFIHKISLNMTTQLVVNDGKSKARIVIYPCRGGRLLNCGVLIETDEQEVADELNAARDSLWLNPGSVEDLLGYLGGYHEAVRQFCGMAEDLKLFSLATRDPPPTFVKGRLALIGDAAHPMLPHLGQGGAQATEDAGTLGALFAPETTADQVGELLDIYNRVRYVHTVTMCIASRVPTEYHNEMVPVLRKFIPDATIPGDLWYRAWISRPDEEVKCLLEKRHIEKVF